MSSEISESSHKRVGSIARSISWSYWWRRLLSWLGFDGLLMGVLYLLFTYKLSDSAIGFASFRDYLSSLSILLFAICAWEVFDLLGIVFDIRRVRRKMQPLQDLALIAEQAANSSIASASKIESLEQAIERASVDSPLVSTGDRDLMSLEIALNGLLRSMNEAKLQQMRFVSDASHELRTPIAVIQGYVNMLDRWGKSDEKVVNESVEALKLESEHMQELVEQLLFLARGDSGRNELEATNFNMAQMMHEVWEESCMIDPDHTYLYENKDGDLSDLQFTLLGDLAMIKQSARIIVQNASKYSASKTTIRMWCESTQNRISYVVQDAGIGMDPEDISHIFDRFYRADNARDESHAGTGLGLSIAQWIIDAHEGEVSVISHKGVGTRFTVSFPRKKASLDPNSTSSPD